jgi:predicted RNase H-like HicB family nuclease
VQYLISLKKNSMGYSAYLPDLEGCVATGATKEEIERNMHDTIEFHLESVRQEGFSVPQPGAYSTYFDIAV